MARRWTGGLIVVGEEHETGQRPDTDGHYQRLEEWARATFDVESVEHTWSAQDYTSVDHIPYVGRSPLRRRTWIATGWRKWGLSNATAAAMVLTASIGDEEHPWQSLFDPGRDRWWQGAVARLARDNLKVGGHLVGDWIGRLHARSLDSLEPGEGAVVRHDGKVFGAYRDDGRQRPLRQPDVHPPRLHRCAGTRPRRRGTAPATARGSATTASCCRVRRSRT